jgi:thiamine-monophosphate kinase
MREFELLQTIYQASRSMPPHVVIGPGDDMALLDLGGRSLLAAVDQIVDGRHVDLARAPIELVGRKAIMRSVSDIAAMAARPVGSLVAVILPREFDTARADALAQAMRNAATDVHCPLVGGDIAVHRADDHPLTCSVTVLAVPAGSRCITRSGAQVGDEVYVTGVLGGAWKDDAGGHHLTFSPRIDEAIQLLALLGDRLHAMIDISDGLGRDASHIASQSKVRIDLDAAAVPCRDGCAVNDALRDGEDYELCFAACGDVPTSLGDVPVTRVGRVTAYDAASDDGARVVLLENANRIPADTWGWQHES